jgi:hypothetical protein
MSFLQHRLRSYRGRMEGTGCPSGAMQRFQSTMDLFFQSIRVQALDRRRGHIPDLESYISLRRDTSGCKPCWALIEYSMNLHIPDEVMEHPCVAALGEATNDLVTWSNVSTPIDTLDRATVYTMLMHGDCRTSFPTMWNRHEVIHTT